MIVIITQIIENISSVKHSIVSYTICIYCVYVYKLYTYIIYMYVYIHICIREKEEQGTGTTSVIVTIKFGQNISVKKRDRTIQHRYSALEKFLGSTVIGERLGQENGGTRRFRKIFWNSHGIVGCPSNSTLELPCSLKCYFDLAIVDTMTYGIIVRINGLACNNEYS